MSHINNSAVLELTSEHIDKWNELGNSLWVEILTRCVDRNDFDELNVQLIKSMNELKQLYDDETFGTRSGL